MVGTASRGGIPVDFRPMSPDDMQRTMQFLLQQQAQFAADFEKLSVKTDRLADAVVGLTAIAGQTVAVVERLAGAQRRTDEQLRHTDEQLQRTDARVAELAEQISRTDSHLGVLIEMFERHLRDDHGLRPS
jgi:hypothetical protein